MIGKIIVEKYKILCKIGNVYIRELYLALGTNTNKQYALRVCSKSDMLYLDHYKKVLRVKEINHPSITQIIDIIENDDTYYIVYEYVEGNTLQEIVKGYGAQSEEDVIQWAKDIAYTLQYIHSLNPSIIFSDLNPRKIFLQPSGQIKLVGLDDISPFEMQKYCLPLDWEVYVTPGYCAPEGFVGDANEKSDIYSLGAIMNFLVTGISPEEPPYILLPIREVNPNLSSRLEYIIEKCTAPNPSERYQNCEELLYDLEGRTGPSNRPSFLERIRQKDFWRMVFRKK